MRVGEKLSDNKPNRRKTPKWGRFLTRINVLLVIIFGLFVVLIIRLGHLQIVQGEAYTELVQSTETSIAEQGVPRGYIVDRNGEMLVDNDGKQAISYTRGPSVSAEDMVETAQSLAKLIDMDTEKITERDRKDYWAAANTDTMNERLSEDEKQLSGSALYDVQLSKITEDDINYNEEELTAVAIFKKMNSAYALSTTFIKNDEVTDEEIARVTEHASGLPGVNTEMDWERSYPQGELIKSVLGDVTTEEEGLPAESADALRALGYARNDRVGESYIEEEYESILRGSKTQFETEVNNNGEIIRSEMTYPGEMGDTVVLTIDTEVQKKIENLAEEYLESRTYDDNNQIFIVLSDPQTGEILSMVGKQRYEDGEVGDYALGTITHTQEMGSAVKGATVAAGYYYDILSADDDNVITDEPLNFSGSAPIASWWDPNNPGEQRNLSDTMALAQSSNVYMAKLALKLGGINKYMPNMNLGEFDTSSSLNKLRNVFQQFGLGASTGIDLENESLGLANDPDNPASALFQSFGQFDTFTPIQLNQYVSTIANDGVRMASHVFKGALEAGTTSIDDGQMIYEETPSVLNKVELEAAEIQRIQDGFHAVVHDPQGLAYNLYNNYPVEVAGKSGTAEVDPANGIEHSTFVGYAPYDDPEVAMSIVIPNVNINEQSAPSAQTLSKDIFDIYFGFDEDSEDADANSETDTEDNPDNESTND